VRVVELATVIAAPVTCALLRDMGASVIKIERPAGDDFRYMGVSPTTKVTGYGDAWGSGFEHCNRGKESVVLDFADPAHLAALRQLIGEADIFVTNVRLSGLRHLELDYEALHARHPRLVYAHLTAWGLGGPEENYPGYDVGAFWAASGLMKWASADDEPGTQPPRFPGGLGDQTTAVHLLAGIMGALYDREKTGQGQHVEACLYRAGIWTVGLPVTTALQVRSTSEGAEWVKAPPQSDFGNPTYNVYPCKDGRWMQLLGLDAARHLEGILAAADPGDTIRSQPQFSGSIADLVRKVARSPDVRRQLIRELNVCFMQRTSQEWMAILKERDVWHHLVSDVNEVVHDAQALAAGAFTDVGGHFPLLSHPIKWSGAPPFAKGRAPALGADTDKVLRRLRQH